MVEQAKWVVVYSSLRLYWPCQKTHNWTNTAPRKIILHKEGEGKSRRHVSDTSGSHFPLPTKKTAAILTNKNSTLYSEK